jgi:hypothetical protein
MSDSAQKLTWLQVAAKLRRLRRGSKRALRALAPAVLALSARERAALKSTWTDARAKSEKRESNSWESFAIELVTSKLGYSLSLGSRVQLQETRTVIDRDLKANRIQPHVAQLLREECDRVERALPEPGKPGDYDRLLRIDMAE